MTVAGWIESWGVGLERDPVGSLFFAIRLLRTMVQREPATDLGVGEGVLAFIEQYGDVSLKTLKQFMYDLGEVGQIPVSREYIIEMMEAEG